MSWQATAWAEKQKTGSPARKVLLLVLANYADDEGYCWPSQKTLARGTEQSIDTVQRQSKRLQADGLIRMERRPRMGGNWPGWIYRLNLPHVAATEPQFAARSERKRGLRKFSTGPQALRPHRAATSTSTGPQALRHEPLKEYPKEPSGRAEDSNAQQRPLRQRTSEGRNRSSIAAAINGHIERLERDDLRTEQAQALIANRLGPNGWEILMNMQSGELHSLVMRQRDDALSDEHLALAAARVGAGQKSEAFSAGTGGHPSQAKS